MSTVCITIKIEYDPAKFPRSDMEWAAEKIAECSELYDIGHDFDSFDKTSEVTYHEGDSAHG